MYSFYRNRIAIAWTYLYQGPGQPGVFVCYFERPVNKSQGGFHHWLDTSAKNAFIRTRHTQITPAFDLFGQCDAQRPASVSGAGAAEAAKDKEAEK